MSKEKKLAALDMGDLIWSSIKGAANTAASGAKWVGGALQGEFNTKATVGQIIVDAVISMFPIAGGVTAARDATAIGLRMSEDPKAAENKWEWISLVLCLLAVIPVVGEVLKGVGRLLVRAANKSEDLIKLGQEILAFLRKMGYGDAHKFLKELNFTKYQSDILKALETLTTRISQAALYCTKRFALVLPAGVKAKLSALPAQMDRLKKLGDRMIPEAFKELNRLLNEVRAKLVDGAYIAPITVGPKTSKVMVTEARLAEFTTKGKSLGHKPVTKMVSEEGWPEIAQSEKIYDEATEKTITKVTGPVNTFSVKNPPTAHSHKPGQKMVRVVQTDRLNSQWGNPRPLLDGCPCTQERHRLAHQMRGKTLLE